MSEDNTGNGSLAVSTTTEIETPQSSVLAITNYMGEDISPLTTLVESIDINVVDEQTIQNDLLPSQATLSLESTQIELSSVDAVALKNRIIDTPEDRPKVLKSGN